MKSKITFATLATAIVLLLFGLPKIMEPYFADIFKRLSIVKTDIDFDTLLQLSVLGSVFFLLSVIGRFEEHKINTRFINHYNKQINLLTQFSGITISYFLYLLMLLTVKAYYSDTIVIESFKTIIFTLILITNYYILFLLVKIYIFESLMDDWDISDFFKGEDIDKLRKKLL